MEMLSGAQKHVNCFDQSYQMLLRDIFNLRQTTVCFQWIQIMIWWLALSIKSI